MTKSFKELRESVVKTADKKPEKYTKPDGKVGIRMVPVNKQIIKNEDASKDAEYHKTLGPTKNSDEGIAALKKKHGMSHDKAVSTLKRLMGMAAKPRKEEVEQLDELSPETLNRYKKKSMDDESERTVKHYDAVLGRAGKKPSWSDTQKTKHKINNRVKGRKLANKKLGFDNNLYHNGKKLTDESVELGEVLDTPKAWNSYMRKSNTSLNKARDKSIFGRTDKAKDKANKTILKRIKGQDMAGKIPDKQFNKAAGAGYVNNKNESVELDESAAASAAAKMVIDREREERRRQTRRWDAEDAAKKSSASKKTTSKPETAAERKARRHAADQVHFGEVGTHHRTKAAEHEKMAKEHDKKTKGISGKLFGGKHKEAARLNNAAAQAHQKAAEVADKVHKAASGKKTSYSSQDAYHKHNDAAIRASGDVHTHKLTKMRESVELDEVLDRPGALDSYRRKADASGNKARNSATRKILTAPKNGERPDHSDELKTMRKRNKGQDMADRVAARQFRKSIGKPYINKESVEYVNEKLKVSDGMGAWVSDFQKSDAPQFKGKSDKERREMAIAAYLSAKRGDKK